MPPVLSATRASQMVPPFWQRLPQILAYPANLDALVKIVCYALAAVVVAAFLPLVGWLIAIFIWIAFLRYAFGILERTSRGHLTAAEVYDNERASEDYRPHKQMAFLFVVMLLTVLATHFFGELAGQVAYVILSLVIPASIMIIALEESLLAALNPARIIFFVRGIGMPYFALCAFLFLMLEGSDILGGALEDFMAEWIADLLVTMVEMYFVIAMYYLMGYVLYQYHATLEVSVEVDPRAAARSVSKNRADELLGPETQDLIAEGQLEQAAQRIETRLKRDWDNNKLHDQYQRVLTLDNQTKSLARHTNEYLPKLVREKKLARAVEVYEACKKKVSDFCVADGTLVLPLATQAVELRRYAAALNLVRGFDKRFPGHDDIAGVFLLAGKVLMEHHHQYDAARRIFSAIIQKYPQHALIPEVRKFLAMSESLLSQTAAQTQKQSPT